MKKIIFLLIIVVIISYFQYNFINKNVDSYEILQYENPSKDIFENILQNKLVSIFTYIPISIDIKNYSKLQKTEKNKINKTLLEEFSYYKIPITYSTQIKVNTELKHSKHQLQKQKNYRELIYQFKGSKRFYIFSPIQQKNIYFNKKKNTSLVDFWNQDTKKYPLVSKSKYIEIILRENQMIYIPNNWIYATFTDEESISIHHISDSIFSKFLNF